MMWTDQQTRAGYDAAEAWMKPRLADYDPADPAQPPARFFVIQCVNEFTKAALAVDPGSGESLAEYMAKRGKE